MSHQHNVLGWRIQPVPFVGTGFLPRLRKVRKTCGPGQTLKCCGSSKSTFTSGRTVGSPPACLKKSGDELFSNTCENITAHVCFGRSELTGLTVTRMTRGDELPRHMIPESEWPRFLQATVAEWAAILDTSAVTIISPAAAKDIRKNCSYETCPSWRGCRSSVNGPRTKETHRDKRNGNGDKTSKHAGDKIKKDIWDKIKNDKRDKKKHLSESAGWGGGPGQGAQTWKTWG